MSKQLELGERLSKAITESKYKAREIADHIGVSPQAISKAIRSHSMGKDNLRKIAEFIGVNEDWLINGKDISKNEHDIELMAKCITAVENAADDLGMKGLDREKVMTAALMLYDANR